MNRYARVSSLIPSSAKDFLLFGKFHAVPLIIHGLSVKVLSSAKEYLGCVFSTTKRIEGRAVTIPRFSGSGYFSSVPSISVQVYIVHDIAIFEIKSLYFAFIIVNIHLCAWANLNLSILDAAHGNFNSCSIYAIVTDDINP
jgi:hypothetical protein